MSGSMKKLAVFFLMFILILDIQVIILASFTNGVVLNSEFYKEEFGKVGLYSLFGEKLKEAAVGDADIQGIDEIITEDWVRSQMESNIQNFVGYLRGDQESFTPTLYLKDIKQGIAESYMESDEMQEHLKDVPAEMQEELKAEMAAELEISLGESMPDEYVMEEGIEVPEEVLLVTRNMAKLRNAAVGLALLVLALTFIIYTDKHLFFRKVGKRIGVAGGISLAPLALFYWKAPSFASMIPEPVPKEAIVIILQDVVLKLGFYTGLVFAVGIAMYATGFGLQRISKGKAGGKAPKEALEGKVFEGKGVSGGQ